MCGHTVLVGIPIRALPKHSNVQYRIDRAGPSGTEQIAAVQLTHEEAWEHPYTFPLTQPGADQRIEFDRRPAMREQSWRLVDAVSICLTFGRRVERHPNHRQ